MLLAAVFSFLSPLYQQSPINDILDKEEFKLEELMQEAELLQEVKARNTRLLEFLCQPDIVSQLLHYVITPAEEGADDLRRFKYPYMSCEIFCCEISNILQMLIEHEDGKFLAEFFSFLDVDGVLDSYLAGYFEKVLEMLLRYNTGPVVKFLNNGGIPMFSQFLKHVDNYSIMQLVQRIMLPHIPFSISAETEMVVPGIKDENQCNWAFFEEICELLCIQMIESTNTDIPSHISDLFITVLQLSPPEAPILSHICNKSCLDRILVAAFFDDADTPSLSEVPTSRACVSLAALSVVESILSRLCETAGLFAEGVTEEADLEAIKRLKDSTENLCFGVQDYFAIIAKQLEKYANAKPCGEMVVQSKQSVSRLGHRGLQLVKLVESLVRLGHADLDKKLCDTKVLSNALELIFVYESNSMLHLSIQRIILMVIESDASRVALQEYIFIESGLLLRLIGEIRKYYPKSLDEGDKDQEGEANGTIDTEAGKGKSQSHPPTLGHFLNIAQAINHTLASDAEDALNDSNTKSVHGDDSAEKEGIEGESPKTKDDGDKNDVQKSAEAGETEDISNNSRLPPSTMSVIMAGDAIAGDWNLFVEEILRPLEARSSVVDNEEYEKEEALDEQMQLQYAMMSLGLQGNQEKDEGEGELEVPRSYADNNDQFHFDEAHDLDDDDIDYADNAVIHQHSGTGDVSETSSSSTSNEITFEANFADFDGPENPKETNESPETETGGKNFSEEFDETFDAFQTTEESADPFASSEPPSDPFADGTSQGNSS